MGVSKNRGGPPKSSIKKEGFPLFSSSILVVKSPYFWFNTHFINIWFLAKEIPKTW